MTRRTREIALAARDNWYLDNADDMSKELTRTRKRNISSRSNTTLGSSRSNGYDGAGRNRSSTSLGDSSRGPAANGRG